MKRNVFLVRIVQSAIAVFLLGMLGGCVAADGIHTTGGGGTTTTFVQGSAILTDPNNSGPHQFPLSIDTPCSFCPDPNGKIEVRFKNSDGSATINVPGRPCPDHPILNSDGATLPDPNNSGPHQFPLNVTTQREFYPGPSNSIRVDVATDGSSVIITVPAGSRAVMTGHKSPRRKK